MKNQEIKQYWNEKAKEIAETDKVTHPDIYQRELEINKIISFLSPADRLLDIGCGNGYSTKIFAQHVKEIVGGDYSEEMIHKARITPPNPPNSSFRAIDVLSLNPSKFGIFDKVVTERCLINLTSWEDQQKALLNIHSVLVEGGTYIMCEGNSNGRENLNKYRKTLNLKEMPTVWHNIDFDTDKTKSFLSEYFIVKAQLGFGLYDLISRIVHPLLVEPDEPMYDAKINKIAKDINLCLCGMEQLSRILFLVLEKK